MFLGLVAFPTFAQEKRTNRITFNDFSFSYDAELASQVVITQYLTEPADVFPPQGKHTLFVLSSEEEPDNSSVGIRVYRMADLAQYDHTQSQLIQLQELLAERRDLTQYVASSENTLPFLPVIAAGQTIHARVAYVATPKLIGISYLTAYQEAAEPLVQHDFLYTFQGISTDGKYYVSAVFRVNPNSFPTVLPADFNYETFLAQMPEYLEDSTTQLAISAPETFTPSLVTLDSIVQSVEFSQ